MAERPTADYNAAVSAPDGWVKYFLGRQEADDTIVTGFGFAPNRVSRFAKHWS